MRELTKQDLRTPFFMLLAVAILGVWYFGVKKVESSHDMEEQAVVSEELTEQPDILEGVVPLSDIRANLRTDGVEGVVGIELGRFRGQAVYVVALQSGDTLLYDATNGLALLDGEALEEDPADVITEVAGATTLDGDFIDLSPDAEEEPEPESEEDPATEEDAPLDEDPAEEDPVDESDPTEEDPADTDPEEDPAEEDPDPVEEDPDPVDDDPVVEAGDDTADDTSATGNSPIIDDTSVDDGTSAGSAGLGRNGAPGQNKS